jgi:hypothetical protein
VLGACLIVLQLAVLARSIEGSVGTGGGHMNGGDPAVVTQCLSVQQGDNRIPAHRSHDCKDCAFCGGREFVLVSVLAHASASGPLNHDVAPEISYSLGGRPTPAPIGWLSSRSSRAPPFFS